MSHALNFSRSLYYILTLVLLGAPYLTSRATHVNCHENINDQSPCDVYEEEWKEANVVIPPVAKDSDFKPLAVIEASQRYHYFLAEKSITRGSDDVMRYTVAIVSENGVRNIFYEGLRCSENEVRIYAYASKRGTFRRASNSRWRPVANKGIRAYQDFLQGVIVCDSNGYAWDADKARQALRSQFLPSGFRRGIVCRGCDNNGFIRND